MGKYIRTGDETSLTGGDRGGFPDSFYSVFGCCSDTRTLLVGNS